MIKITRQLKKPLDVQAETQANWIRIFEGRIQVVFLNSLVILTYSQIENQHSRTNPECIGPHNCNILRWRMGESGIEELRIAWRGKMCWTILLSGTNKEEMWSKEIWKLKQPKSVLSKLWTRPFKGHLFFKKKTNNRILWLSFHLL